MMHARRDYIGEAVALIAFMRSATNITAPTVSAIVNGKR
jgi:hypothetical protein